MNNVPQLVIQPGTWLVPMVSTNALHQTAAGGILPIQQDVLVGAGISESLQASVALITSANTDRTITAEDIARGFVQTRIGTNEEFDFSPPQDATAPVQETGKRSRTTPKISTKNAQSIICLTMTAPTCMRTITRTPCRMSSTSAASCTSASRRSTSRYTLTFRPSIGTAVLVPTTGRTMWALPTSRTGSVLSINREFLF